MEDNNTGFEDKSLTNNEMSDIYMALSTSDNTDIDIIDDLKFVQQSIINCFDDKFKMIETEKLQKDSLLINKKFLELVVYCKERKFKKIGYIFIGFCDYFDLDFNKTYNELYEKLQILIQYSAKCLIGVKNYEKIKLKNSEHPEIYIPTLFDIIKNK